MKLDQVMSALAAKGSAATKKTFFRHGAKEPLFGVKIADLKVIQKKFGRDQTLALQLYATGNGDAQYLAGMMADGAGMTAAQLDTWAETAGWCMISRTIVPWVASENSQGFALARKWIDSSEEGVAVAGWGTLIALATIVPDDDLPLKQFGALLNRVAKTLPKAPNEVRSAMNSFVIACGTYVAPLGQTAITAARTLGKVEIDVGDTACEIPEAESTILKRRGAAPVAPKRKTVRC